MPTEPISELASQLQAFISAEHSFVSDLDPAILQSIEYFALPPSSPTPVSTERASRSVARPPKSSTYPVKWADARVHLRSAVRQFQKLLNQRTAFGSTSAAPEALWSHANFPMDPIDSIITEESALLIPATPAPETHQMVNQETATMASSSNSSSMDHVTVTPRIGPEERQEIMQMMIDLFDRRERQRQESHDTTDLTGQARSTTSTDSTTQATLKASEIGYFFPNMPLT
jgi:hypothetical protein